MNVIRYATILCLIMLESRKEKKQHTKKKHIKSPPKKTLKNKP